MGIMKQFLISLCALGVWGIPTVSLAHVAIDAAYLAGLGLHEGDIVGSTAPSDPDVYIINEVGYRRLFLNPIIFSFYGHLRFENVKRFPDTVIESFPISPLFRNCETNDPKVYALQVTAEDAGVLHWVNVSGEAAVAEDPDFFQRIFCINSREFGWYAKSSAYTSLAQIPVYQRATAPAQGINDTTLPLNVPAGLRISLFTPKIGPLRFMAFSPDGILFVSMPSSAGLYSGSGVDDGAIFALPDRDHNGTADTVTRVLSGLHMPHGIAFHGGYLYVAEEGTVSRYPYTDGGTVGTRQVIAHLPTGGEHISRTIGFSPAGKMYVSVGSSCNDCSPAAAGTGAIWEFNADGSGGRIFAQGIRNAVGFVFHPTTSEIWATENGRDFLGDNLPPDEINIVRDGGHYGWPKCYGAKITDPKYGNSAFCQTTVSSVYDLQAHSAPLGLRFITGSQMPASWQGDLLVARHGSWNRTQPVGYDVIRLDVQGNAVVGEEPFITGWLTASGQKIGRPVDVIVGPDGAVYISDDKVNAIYRVVKSP